MPEEIHNGQRNAVYPGVSVKAIANPQPRHPGYYRPNDGASQGLPQITPEILHLFTKLEIDVIIL